MKSAPRRVLDRGACHGIDLAVRLVPPRLVYSLDTTVWAEVDSVRSLYARPEGEFTALGLCAVSVDEEDVRLGCTEGIRALFRRSRRKILLLSIKVRGSATCDQGMDDVGNCSGHLHRSSILAVVVNTQK